MNTLKKYKYYLKGLDCAACAIKVQEELAKHQPYQNVNVNFSTLRLTFETEEKGKVKENVKKIIAKVEPEVEVVDQLDEDTASTPFLKLGIGVFLGILGITTNFPYYISEILTILGYLILLSRTLKNAFQILKNSHSIDENFLVSISCMGAYLIGESLEGFMVILLYEIGKILEEKAIHHTRKSIKALMDIKPEYANRKEGDTVKKVDPQELKKGDRILVKAGEKIPVDGVVKKGEAKLDTSALTGESNLRPVTVGEEVLSGSINVTGLLEIEVTCEYENSTVSRILQLVENATDKKAKTETFVSKTAKIYTPIVIVLAILVGIFLPVFTSETYSTSIYRALIFLVISCPCAIAISVPLSYFTGIGRASKEGILIKGSDYLDGMKEVKTIVFDKTGTLTTGSFAVSKVERWDPNYSEEKILEILAKGESFSNHPIAKCILEKVKSVDTSDVSNYKEGSGKGIEYEIKGVKVKAGTKAFCGYEGENQEGTTVFLNYDGKIIASVSITDGIKEGAKELIASLSKRGIQTAMFTGDNEKVAESIAKKLGIKEVKANLLPEEKYQNIEKIMKETKDGKVAFVGDGINDAPVLARSDIGISMGNIGSSSAIEASDIVIMTDQLEKIENALEISDKTRSIIKQNLIFALATKVLILSLSIIGYAGMWQAIFADVGVTLLTILNTTRILKK